MQAASEGGPLRGPSAHTCHLGPQRGGLTTRRVKDRALGDLGSSPRKINGALGMKAELAGHIHLGIPEVRSPRPAWSSAVHKMRGALG